MAKKYRVRYLAFGFRPNVSFCSVSAKNFHFGASLKATLKCAVYSCCGWSKLCTRLAVSEDLNRHCQNIWPPPFQVVPG